MGEAAVSYRAFAFLYVPGVVVVLMIGALVYLGPQL